MLRRKAGGYAHAKPFKRLKRLLSRQRTKDKDKLTATRWPRNWSRRRRCCKTWVSSR
jgi:hypothetical protein